MNGSRQRSALLSHPTRPPFEERQREKQHLNRLVRRAPPDGAAPICNLSTDQHARRTGAAFARIVPDGSNAESEDEHENPLPYLVLDIVDAWAEGRKYVPTLIPPSMPLLEPDPAL
ncbi:hypothetical protein FJW06_19900 [Mesorhizobium sp. B4-1-3]|nr:hypothetical protein FJW06_19900 [Mesorhizobium sp. B4-1-3]